MANISDATGSVEILATTKVAVFELYKAIKAHECFEYGTYLYDDCVVEHDETEEPYEYRASFGFGGSGRWAYQCNIENFLNWSVSAFADLEYPQEEIPDWKLLQNSDFELRFEYADEESGCEVLYKSKDVLIHHKGDPVTKCEFINEYFEEYEHNLENMCSVLDSVPDEIVENFLIMWDGDCDGLYSAAEENRDFLEHYYENSIENILKSFGQEYLDQYLEGKENADE